VIAALCTLLALAMGGGSAALAAPPVRVAIVEGARAVEVGGTALIVADRAGRALGGRTPTWLRVGRKGGAIELRGHGFEVRAPHHEGVRLSAANGGMVRVNKRDYPGAIEVLASGDHVVVVNELPLEEYLAGAVKAEAGDRMPLEMLKAQAIVARTYAVYHQQLNSGKAYQLVASTAHQQYAGGVAGDSPVWAAVRATEGQVMLWQGALFPAFYHTDSGGHTEDPRAVFAGRNMPALKPVRVDFPSASPHDEWRLDMPLSELGALLLKRGISVGRVVALEVLERSASLRVSYIAIRGLKGTATLRGNDLRQLIGYDTLKSTLFAVAVSGTVARFVGRGYGHGVGLDQWRAKTMAELGYDARQILEYYYPGAVLASLP
jgi:stage II sporulation protein D